ncbi:MAG: xanthine dehydrogenase family protein subunit M, partial [Alicyclobacillus sp.]|nr:xanthine dehydrogenase family protein subunit M [Alicyclobacillus sp.]
MKPPSFDYYRPDNLEEALAALAELGSDGKVLAGGQSLVPMLNMRLSAPACLIDINGLAELNYLRWSEGWLHIGALTRQRVLELDPLVRQRFPLLTEALPWIGHVQTRNRGTVGGSVVHADPTAELPLSLQALSGVAVLSSAQGQREVPLASFFLTYMTTDLGPDELLTEVKVPVPAPQQGWAFVEFSQRRGDFALVDVACLLQTDAQGKMSDVRLLVGGVDGVPLPLVEAEQLLDGECWGAALQAELQQLVAASVEPEADVHGSAEYKRHLA